jgi:hypothetical protein
MRFSLRSFFSFATLALLIASFPSFGRSSTNAATDGGIAITRVFTGWKEGASFKRISEYFTGQENSGNTVVLRTHADQRSGFYFLVRASNPGGPVSAKINLELITPSDHRPKTYTFSTELKTGANLLNLGLTADDWTDPKANPVAWKIDFISTDGHVLASEKSYLWAKPEKN